MKKNIQILIYLLSVSLLAQENLSGTVTYKKLINIDFDKNSNIDNRIINKYQSIKNSMDLISYRLIFNEKKSIFQMEKLMESSYQKIPASVISKGYGNGVHYVDLENKTYIHSNELEGKIYNVSKNEVLKFKLINKTKKIGDYYCYKAEAEETLNMFGVTNVITYVAWYCPQIPYNFGPVMFYGLPGLVLEANINNIKYLAVNIDLADREIIVNPPKEGEEISQDNFNNLIKNIIENKMN